MKFFIRNARRKSIFFKLRTLFQDSFLEYFISAQFSVEWLSKINSQSTKRATVLIMTLRYLKIPISMQLDVIHNNTSTVTYTGDDFY